MQTREHEQPVTEKQLQAIDTYQASSSIEVNTVKTELKYYIPGIQFKVYYAIIESWQWYIESIVSMP